MSQATAASAEGETLCTKSCIFPVAEHRSVAKHFNSGVDHQFTDDDGGLHIVEQKN